MGAVHPLLPALIRGRSAAASRSRGRDQARPGPPAGTRATPAAPEPKDLEAVAQRLTPRWRCGETSSAAAARASGGAPSRAAQVGENLVDHSGLAPQRDGRFGLGLSV